MNKPTHQQVASYCWQRAHKSTEDAARSFWFSMFEVAITLAEFTLYRGETSNG